MAVSLLLHPHLVRAQENHVPPKNPSKSAKKESVDAQRRQRQRPKPWTCYLYIAAINIDTILISTNVTGSIMTICPLRYHFTMVATLMLLEVVRPREAILASAMAFGPRAVDQFLLVRGLVMSGQVRFASELLNRLATMVEAVFMVAVLRFFAFSNGNVSGAD